jgi:arsenate reductase (glutaredoxin)
MTLTLFGIANCDTVKKARVWLEGQGIKHAFHDYKKAGVTEAQLGKWCAELGWEVVLNRSGTTFRNLDASDKENLGEAKAITLMQAQPSMIKRPIAEHAGGLLIGFKASDYEKAFV